MKTIGIFFLLSGLLFAVFEIATEMYGVHSTPGIWLALVNFPGILLVVWINGWMGFSIAIFVNSLVYFGAFKIFSGLKRN